MDTLHDHARTSDAAPIPSHFDDHASKPEAVIAAGRALLPFLERGQKLDADILRTVMREATGGDDAAGAWVWKTAYDAAEIALVLFLDKHLRSIEKRASSPVQALSMLGRVQALFSTHTKRSDESVALQQFSTPLALAYLVERAACVKPSDLVLEPSAGTGLLAVFARARRAHLLLNEIADTRAHALGAIFEGVRVSRHNAEHIHDLLPAAVAPSVVLMNPPFSASPKVTGRMAGIDARHVRSAFARLVPDGRLVAITSENFDPWETLRGHGTVMLSVVLDGAFFKPHGTSIGTRLSVVDKAVRFSSAPQTLFADTPGELLELISTHVTTSTSARLDCKPVLPKDFTPASKPAPIRAVSAPTSLKSSGFGPADGVELEYSIAMDVRAAEVHAGEGIYEPYRVERIVIPGAKPHPDKLVQSAAMASVSFPAPTYRPHVTPNLIADGLLSDAQLETLIYAGEAHGQMLKGHWLVKDDLNDVTPASPDDPQAVQFRRAFFIGDGTGVGKGRENSAIILDNWLKGRKRALWISKSGPLIEDAQRDWSALGQEKLLIVAQDRYKQGQPIDLDEGILFTTYATLRQCNGDGQPVRLQQILDWLGKDFDGAIIFDEAHAMANAAGEDSDRGYRKPSQQGLMGLRLQNALPKARFVYVSATGATSVENLAYAQRLGLWGSDDMPFNTRDEFIGAMLEGGIAAMEVVARDLKSLGLYTARSLSLEGVVVDILVHELTAAQVKIYDAYAEAYQIIHTNLQDALNATGINSPEGATRNKNAKSAALSAFEGSKLRFFSHLLVSMKMPSLIRAITEDLGRGDAAIVQLVTTSEALLDRRLEDIPVEEWGDLSIDITPREYVMDYLNHSFPTKVFETKTDSKGKPYSELLVVNGNAVECREAVAQRDAMLERLQSLPPVQSALDQIIQTFGADRVAEITGRSRRIVKKKTDAGMVLAVERRSGHANLVETQAFMDDEKQVLVFSEAGGTGRSYHADRACRNQRQRIHYLPEPGYKAAVAIQGLGRSNRTNQKQPPRLRPVTTNVKADRRFTSVIARRLDHMGAITRGERKTGGQGLFRAEDNLENEYAWSARRTLFRLLVDGKVECCSYARFVEATGLNLRDEDGMLKDDLPPMHTFLNRMLALPIQLQNELFEVLEGLIAANVEAAIAADTYDVGLETITAESLTIASRHIIASHPSGATTLVLEVKKKHKPKPLTLEAAFAEQKWHGKRARLLFNSRSKRAALEIPTHSITLEDGRVQQRVRLLHPMDAFTLDAAVMEDTFWTPCGVETFSHAWQQEIDALPPWTESTFHVVAGLLLPLWKRLKAKHARVYRFVTDDGERVIGRLIPAETVIQLTGSTPAFDAKGAWAWVQSGMALTLEEDISIKRRLIMRVNRLEVTGFDGNQLAWFKAQGCFTETISYQTRLFVPTGDDGPTVLDRIMSRFPHAPASQAELEQLKTVGGMP